MAWLITAVLLLAALGAALTLALCRAAAKSPPASVHTPAGEPPARGDDVT